MSTTLQRKVTSILSHKFRLESADVTDALNGLEKSHVYDINRSSGDNRKHLSSTLEQRTLEMNQSFIQSFQPFKQQILDMESSLNSLSSLCKSITKQLEDSQVDTQELIDKSNNLNQSKEVVEKKQETLERLLSRFTLRENEIELIDKAHSAAMHGADLILDDEYFHAIQRLITIKDDVEKYMMSGNVTSGTPYYYRYGLDILDISGKRLEMAFETLYKYCQLRVNNTSYSTTKSAASGAASEVLAKLDNVDDIQSNIVMSFALLSRMSVYYDHCISELINARKMQLITRFLRALSKGTNTSRAIEISAHDTFRYVSDMLAWCHNALANETEFIKTLLPHTLTHTNTNISRKESSEGIERSTDNVNENDSHNHNGSASTITSTSASPASSSDKSYMEIIGQIADGLSRSLRQRVEQSLASQHNGVVTSYKVWNLLQFYTQLQIAPLLPHGSPFLLTLNALADTAKQTLFNSLTALATKLQHSGNIVTYDLSTPPILIESMQQLNSIMEMYTTSLAVSSMQEKAEDDFHPIVNAAIDPLIDAIKKASVNLNVEDQHTYYINVLQYMVYSMKRYDFVKGRVQSLIDDIVFHTDELTNFHANNVLSKSHLKEKLDKLHGWQQHQAQAADPKQSQPLSAISGMDTLSLQSSFNSFYNQLYSVGSFLLPQCDRVLHPLIRSYCRSRIAASISNAYRELYMAINDPINKYTDTSSICQHTPNEIDMLLDVNKQQQVSPSGERRRERVEIVSRMLLASDADDDTSMLYGTGNAQLHSTRSTSGRVFGARLPLSSPRIQSHTNR